MYCFLCSLIPRESLIYAHVAMDSKVINLSFCLLLSLLTSILLYLTERPHLEDYLVSIRKFIKYCRVTCRLTLKSEYFLYHFICLTINIGISDLDDSWIKSKLFILLDNLLKRLFGHFIDFLNIF